MARHVYDWDWGAAEAEYPAELDVNPANAGAQSNLAVLLSPEAVGELQTAMGLSGRHPWALGFLGMTWAAMGDT